MNQDQDERQDEIPFLRHFDDDVDISTFTFRDTVDDFTFERVSIDLVDGAWAVAEGFCYRCGWAQGRFCRGLELPAPLQREIKSGLFVMFHDMGMVPAGAARFAPAVAVEIREAFDSWLDLWT